MAEAFPSTAETPAPANGILAARFAKILESGLHSDVTLIVGEGKVKVQAHKLLLRTASSEFEKLFTEIPEKNEFEIPEFDPLVFQQFLKYVYTEVLVPQPESAIQFLQLANRFKMPELTQKCGDVLKADLTEKNALRIFKQALQYDENILKENAKRIICKFAYKIIETDEFLELSEECLVELLELDEFSVKDELQLFFAIMRWAGAECVRQKAIVNPKYCASMLEKLIPLIRFPQIDESDFALHVSFLEVLTPDQLGFANVYYKISLPQRFATRRGPFNPTPRNYHLPTKDVILNRLNSKSRKCLSVDGSTNEITWHRICFKANSKVWMTSIGLNSHLVEPRTGATPAVNEQDCKKGQEHSSNHGLIVLPDRFGLLDWTDEPQLTQSKSKKSMKPKSSGSGTSCTVEVRLEDEGLENIFAVKTEKVRTDDMNNAGHHQVKFDRPVKIEKDVWYTASLRVGGDYTGFIYEGRTSSICKDSDGNDVKVEFRQCISSDSSPETTTNKGQMATFGLRLY